MSLQMLPYCSIIEIQPDGRLQRATEPNINAYKERKMHDAYIGVPSPDFQDIISDAHTEYVYFMRSGNFIKIGRTRDLKKRISGVRTANPHGVYYLGAIALPRCFNGVASVAPHHVEKALHKRFSSQRHEREWFTVSIFQFLDLMEEYCYKMSGFYEPVGIVENDDGSISIASWKEVLL